LSNYSKVTNFTAKDALATGNPSKVIKGTEIDTELAAISVAIATKLDSTSPETQKLTMEAQASVATPATDDGVLYVKLVSGNPELFYKDDAANDIQLTSGGSINPLLVARASKPTLTAGRGAVYTKEVSSVVELFYEDDDGVEIQLTSGGAINVDTGVTYNVTNLVSEGTASASNFKAGVEPVTVSDGNFTFDLDAANVFYITLSANATVTFVADDPTKSYSFSVVVTNAGSFIFTALTMTGVTIYQPKDLARILQPSGRTVIGCLYNGAAATLDIFPVEMEER
jgi:hypothetical protein